ncbi:MAG: FAD-dependent monooxygenase [Gemmatimonadetes bacterium]|nr:FAD-dependent monooxygenase [Gemmatimonadota bacterium]
MKKLLIQLDSDRLPSSFDRIVGYDAGAEEVLSYGAVTPKDVRDLVYGAIFTRGPKDLNNTAVFVGGADIRVGEQLLEEARKAFFGPFKVSLMLDSNGSNTTAVAAVVKLIHAAGGVKGKRAVVVAGTGPVGTRAAGLLARAGAEVTITSRERAAADQARAAVEERFGCQMSAVAVGYPLGRGSVVDGPDLVLATGPPGVQLVKREAWVEGRRARVLGDVNAVPPFGIGGVEAADDGTERDGARTFGALGIGGLKMKLHKACIARLFETNDLILDAETIYEVAESL